LVILNGSPTLKCPYISKKTVVYQYFTLRLKNALQVWLLVMICCLAACQTTPPVQEMSDARQAIAVARAAGAADLASIHLKAAERYLASAERELGERAYGKARRNAKQAKMKALDALQASDSQSDSNDN